jgi:hypothetical protein
MDSTTPSQPFAARRLPVTTQAIHHGQISTAPIVRTTSMPSTITQAVPQSTNATFFVPATSASHGCLPAYNASLQGPSTSSDSQLSDYNASLQVQPTSSDSHTVNAGTGLPIMSTFTQPQYTSRVTVPICPCMYISHSSESIVARDTIESNDNLSRNCSS